MLQSVPFGFRPFTGRSLLRIAMGLQIEVIDSYLKKIPGHCPDTVVARQFEKRASEILPARLSSKRTSVHRTPIGRDLTADL